MKDVTAIIKTFLRDRYLFECVESLHKTYPDMLISVADDGDPSDEKEAKLKELGVTRYIRMPYASGLSAGRNVLLDACDTPYLLLCDDDMFFNEASNIEKLYTLMGVADIAGGAFLQYGAFVHNYSANLIQEGNQFRLAAVEWPSFEEYNGVRYGQCDLTHNIFVAKTDKVRKVRWEDGLKIRFEHEDFFMTAKQQGLKVVYCPDVAVAHKLQGYTDIPEFSSHRWDDTSSREVFLKKWGFIWNNC